MSTQILVVEDERLVARALQNELEQFGYEVSGIASSASEAVAQVEESRPDLVLMDVHLKGDVDGIEAAQRIQSRCGIPVIYLSAFSDATTVARASETNAFGYLIKPYEERELQTTIEMALAKHRAERQLEEAQRWLAAIHNGIDDAVIAADPENNIHSMNFAAEAITGWPMEDAIGVPLTAVCNLVDADGRIVHEDFVDRVVCESRTLELPDTTRLIARDDRETPVEGSISPIYDSRGDFLGTVLVLRNVAARLELDRLRRQTEERARRAQKTQAVGRLAGGLSHHLSDMLTVILGNTSLVLADLSNESDQFNSCQLLQDVELAAQNAASLIQRLRMLSRFTGDTADGMRQLDLNEFISECVSEVKPLLNSRIQVKFEPADDLWPVRADETLLGQAILELAANARDAMPQGGQLSLELTNVSIPAADLVIHPDGQAGEFVRLRISDTGRGIPSAAREQLFEPFVNDAASNKGRGLGTAPCRPLPSSIVAGLSAIARLDGRAQFELYLPRHGVEAPAEDAPPRRESLAAPGRRFYWPTAIRWCATSVGGFSKGRVTACCWPRMAGRRLPFTARRRSGSTWRFSISTCRG